jgi:hypothetical protein
MWIESSHAVTQEQRRRPSNPPLLDRIVAARISGIIDWLAVALCGNNLPLIIIPVFVTWETICHEPIPWWRSLQWPANEKYAARWAGRTRSRGIPLRSEHQLIHPAMMVSYMQFETPARAMVKGEGPGVSGHSGPGATRSDERFPAVSVW